VATGEESSHRGLTEPQSQVDLRGQETRKAEADPQVPEVFKTEKAGKAKVDEGRAGEGARSSEGNDKPFCFRCYKPRHGKLVCTAKLRCEICGSNEHMTSKCPILKQPPLLAHPYGYDMSGLGFYHIPHALITLGKSENHTTLVMVQGGVISIPQVVIELSWLIPKKWLWDVTQQDDNSFIVPSPSRGDLHRSVAFGKADIKELGVSLLFEEWKEEEEGLPLQRVWIRIFRLPKKLWEFLVLWALGSMLGTTQSVDMTTYLKRNYRCVEVVVLNVDLLPNSIDTVVIGDKMFSLPIQVEGVEGNKVHNN
jgi:hypothetical protein